MLSRIALRSGSFGAGILRNQSYSGSLVAVRAAATQPHTQDDIERAHELFNGPDRDYKNFPAQSQPIEPGKVRLGFLPEEWFQNFYNKTGVTGPYIFGTGLIATLLSKEIWVVDHGFTEVISYWIAFVIIAKKWGPQIGSFLDQKVDRLVDTYYHKPMATQRKDADQFIKQADKIVWAQEGQKYLYEAKKENVGLQLEEQYRKRLSEVHVAVKNRLDYLLDIQNANRRFEQDHMTNWIVDNVMKSITPQSEKEALKQCITDLKGLAAKA